MDFSPNRRSDQQDQAAPAAVPPSNARPAAPQTAKKGWTGMLTSVAVAVLAIVVLLVGIWLVFLNKDNSASQIQQDKYQAVFLTNGQVYFGKLSQLNNQYVKLTDVYYLQVNQSSKVQPKSDDKSKTDSDNQNNGLKLIHLGGEIHGPEDQMEISNKQVLFWENLKNDGKVVQAIKNYNQKKQ